MRFFVIAIAAAVLSTPPACAQNALETATYVLYGQTVAATGNPPKTEFRDPGGMKEGQKLFVAHELTGEGCHYVDHFRQVYEDGKSTGLAPKIWTFDLSKLVRVETVDKKLFRFVELKGEKGLASFAGVSHDAVYVTLHSDFERWTEAYERFRSGICKGSKLSPK